jgi:oxygen-independent coproporphyrinogen-3 oxidase
MMNNDLLDKYNVPVPRYTSYPPANYFTETFTAKDYEAALEASDGDEEPLSFYIHIPFCRRLCHFCGCNSFAATTPRRIARYIEALHREIDRLTKRLNPRRRIAQIHYGGGTPTILPADVLKELNDRLFSSFPAIDRPEIAIECHPAYSDENYWHALTKSGFNRFSLGIQDFDETVLKTVNRRPPLLPVDAIIDILRTNDAGINLDFIYGLPQQTVENFAKTIRRAIELQPDRLVTFSYAHLPDVNRRQLILEKAGLPNKEQKSRMYSQARELLHGAGYKTIGLDHFVKDTDELYFALQNGQLHRNFQGYCTRRTTAQVYAIGATAISQLAGAYAQNSKNIDDYIALVETGWATAKGYRLNKEEQITREVIETLLCNYSLNWEELSQRLSLPPEKIKQATAYNPAVFDAFAKDGIIVHNERQIRITPHGTLFVRNVAAALDRLMLHSNKTFSTPV